MSELSPLGGSEGYEARDDEADAQRCGQCPVEERIGSAEINLVSGVPASAGTPFLFSFSPEGRTEGGITLYPVLPEAREKGWYPVFCVPSPRAPPPEGRGQNLLEAQRKRWYPVFCVPSPCPRPRRGRGRKTSRRLGEGMVSKLLCLFHSVATKWLPKTAGNHWGRRGGKNGNFCMATKWLPRELFREKRFPFFLFWGDFSTFSADVRGVVPG